MMYALRSDGLMATTHLGEIMLFETVEDAVMFREENILKGWWDMTSFKVVEAKLMPTTRR